VIEKLRERLQARAHELLKLSVTSRESRKSVELDQTRVGRLSRMNAMQMQAMFQENERLRQAEIGRIKVAIRRIETDDYGYCVHCDEAIAPKRLELDPSILSCIECARRREGSTGR